LTADPEPTKAAGAGITAWTGRQLRRMDMAKSGIRRTVIREWMSLAREKRQSREQAAAFAKNSAQRHSLPRSRRDPSVSS
jgi:rRNA-processing protein FCF1